MTPIPLSDLRAILRQSPVRARLLWSEGLGVALTAPAAQGAVAGMASADLSGHRFSMLADVASQTKAFHLPKALISVVQMDQGWLGRADVIPTLNPLSEIGPALALLALASALAGQDLPSGTVSHDPAGGVRVALAG